SAEALLASLIVVLVAAILAYLAHRSSRSPPDPRGRIRLDVLLIVTVAVALLVFALREALDQNFWTYPTILVGVVTAGVHRPLQRWLDRAYPGRAPTGAPPQCRRPRRSPCPATFRPLRCLLLFVGAAS